MSVDLPSPLDLYFASENTDATDILDRCFAADASVSDEAQTHSGLAAIKAWKTEGKRKTGYTVAVDGIVTQGVKTTVLANVAGNFPGSPVMLSYRFTVVEDLIDTLEISS